MTILEEKTMITLGAITLVAVGAAYLIKKAGDAGGAGGLGAAAAGAVVDAAAGAATGTVIAIGKQVGIPETSQTECQKAMAEGRTWDASFACPAKDFLAYVFNGKTTINTSKIDGITPADRNATSGGAHGAY